MGAGRLKDSFQGEGGRPLSGHRDTMSEAIISPTHQKRRRQMNFDIDKVKKS